MNILITGANRGLGLCLTEIFAQNGHKVAACFRENADLTKLKITGEKYNGLINFYTLDLSCENSVKAAKEHIKDDFGKLDVIINNAAVLLDSDRSKNICEIDLADLKETLEINIVGTVSVMKYFLPLLIEKGTFLAISSEAGCISSSGDIYSAYSISKAAVNKAIFILRATFGNKYRILTVHPGRMNTDMGKTTAQIEPEEAATGIYKIISGRTQIDDNQGFIDYQGQTMPL